MWRRDGGGKSGSREWKQDREMGSDQIQQIGRIDDLVKVDLDLGSQKCQWWQVDGNIIFWWQESQVAPGHYYLAHRSPWIIVTLTGIESTHGKHKHIHPFLALGKKVSKVCGNCPLHPSALRWVGASPSFTPSWFRAWYIPDTQPTCVKWIN